MSSLKGMRDANEAPTGHTKRGTQNSSPIEVQTSQQAQEVVNTSRGANISNGVFTQCLPKDCKQVLDTVQRLACIGLAIWDFISMRNPWAFLALLAAGQIDPRAAKDVLARVLKAILTEGK